jgi:hypothetical protein
VIPYEVRAAAELLKTWALDEGWKMRQAGVMGPAVNLFELVGAVCEYFLCTVGGRQGK